MNYSGFGVKQGTHLRVKFHRHNCDSFAAVNCHAVYHIHSKTAQKVEKWVLSYCFYSLTVQTNSHNHIGLFASWRFIWWSNLYCHWFTYSHTVWPFSAQPCARGDLLWWNICMFGGEHTHWKWQNLCKRQRKRWPPGQGNLHLFSI